MRVTFRQLLYFVSAADRGSTSRAAAVLNVSQPAISMAISQLESIFGQKLFIRDHIRGLVVTPFGRRKLAESRNIIAQVNGLAEEPLRGTLEIGGFSTVAAMFIPGIVRDFRRAYPEVSIQIHECNLEELHRHLESGTIEVALMYDLHLGTGMKATVVAEEKPYALLPQGHPLAQHDAVSIRSLAQEPFVLIDLPHSRDYFMSLFRMVETTPNIAMECTSLEMVRGLVANGLGVAMLVTRPHASTSYDGRRLAHRNLVEEIPPQRVIVATSVRFPPQPVARAFIKTALQYFSRRASSDKR
jgi:DNA-binding transcriptional LysR family regulator